MSPRRTSRAFDWHLVDRRIVRAMLEQAYLDEDRNEDAERITRLEEDRLVAQATRSLGRPPGARYFTDGMVEVLRQKWLPRADPETVRRLAITVQAGLSGSDRTRNLRNKPERIEFLCERRRTTRFVAALRSSFVSAHKGIREVAHPGPGSSDEAPNGAVELAGEGAPRINDPYPHQLAAWRELDNAISRSSPSKQFRGRIVLPTGSGKTDTAARWLLEQMAADPELRVLWLAHQQELLAQAVTRFQNLARHLPVDFRRSARRIHSGASAISTLSSTDLDLAAVTIQSLARDPERKRRHLDSFLERPTVVVVDEAHHAASPSYDALLETLERCASVSAVIGLTATPYPTSAYAKHRFAHHFGTPVIERSANELIADGILARPVLHTVETGTRVTMSDKERRTATTSDFAPETLQKLDRQDRNALAVATWAADPKKWGKTLVFATSIEHAETLGAAFKDVAPTRVLHSRSEETPSHLLNWFRGLTKPGVLVSVGMLTEGVDLPDARTAMLARPTVSRVLLQQMIGRVLRGPRTKGGEAEAHVVYLRDEWERFGDVLEPGEVVEQPEMVRVDRNGTERRLPPVITDDGGERQIPSDAAASIERQMDADRRGANLDDDDPRNDRSLDPLLTTTRLCGYYRLGDRSIPVFEHQLVAYERLLADVLKWDMKGTPFISYFEDRPPPYPSRRTLRELVEEMREAEAAPEFIQLDAIVGPAIGADRIEQAGYPVPDAKAELLESVYDTSIARHVYSSFDHFAEAVDAELRERARRKRRYEPERPLRESPPGAAKVPRWNRDLDDIKVRTLAEARRLLPPEHAARLDDPPPLRWTDSVVSSTWGHWSLSLSKRNAGRQIIRINRLLRTRRSIVSDEMLCYLVYHELLHHLLPGQGHDAEFRKLEALWPNATELDLEYDTFHERWDTRPESYNT
jgi:superfamily II DNA or RNA helicase/predicted metal-dependent hydrolase